LVDEGPVWVSDVAGGVKLLKSELALRSAELARALVDTTIIIILAKRFVI
jgi:hypothetical protein